MAGHAKPPLLADFICHLTCFVPLHQDAALEQHEAQMRQQQQQLLMGKPGPSVSQFGPNPGAGVPGMCGRETDRVVWFEAR